MRYLCCRWILRALSIVIINCNSQAQITEKPQISTEIEHLTFAVVNVAAIDSANPTNVALKGTAVYIDPEGYLLTCAHVIDAIPQNTRKTLLVNKIEADFDVVKLDRFLDLALLHTAMRPKYFLAISEDNYPHTGLPAIFAGFPDRPNGAVGLPSVSIKRCIISNLEPLTTTVPTNPLLYIKIDQLAFFGNSGGPLLSASDMVLIGIMKSIAASGYSYAIPAKNIRAFIGDIAQKAVITTVSENQGPVRWLAFRISQELRDHNDYLKTDMDLLEASLKAMESGQTLIQPPFRLGTGIWEEIWFDSRSSRLFSPELLGELRSYYLSAKAFNELLQARESIRLSQWALSNREKILQVHDQELLTMARRLTVTLTDLIAKLQ